MAGKTQLDFLEGLEPPRVSPQIDPAERPRLSRQCRQILEMLKSADRSNRELAAVSHRFSARIYELRKHGYIIREVHKDTATGLRVYRLEGDT